MTTMSTPAQSHPGWQRNVSLFLAGQTVSLFGSMIVQYAVMWWITLETQNGTLLALSTVFGFLPQAVVSVFGGVWADRHSRKLLIVTADLSIAAATLALALLMMNGHSSMWLIFTALAIRSAGAGVQSPAVGALIPQLVPGSQLMRINGLNQSIQAGMMLIAPAVAALLYANLPLERIFFVDVVTAVIGVGLLLLVPVARLPRPAERASYTADLVAGLRYTNGHRVVRWLIAFNAAVMVLAAAPSFLTPLMVARSFGEEVWKLTALEIAFSVGMLAAGATIGWWGTKTTRIALLAGASVAFGVCSIGLGLSPVLWVFLAFMLAVGFVVPAFTTPVMTSLQQLVPPERQGRVFGVVGVVMAVAMPLGMALFGPLADVWSVGTVLIVAGSTTLVATGLAFLTPTGRAVLADVRTDPEHALAFGVPERPAEAAGTAGERSDCAGAAGEPLATE